MGRHPRTSRRVEDTLGCEIVPFGPLLPCATLLQLALQAPLPRTGRDFGLAELETAALLGGRCLAWLCQRFVCQEIRHCSM
jgi:hypothetical protein